MRVIIAGGGTGGHLFPGLAIAKAFEQRFEGCVILFVGTERGLEKRLVPQHGYPLALIGFARLKNTGVKERITNLARVPGRLLESRRILRRFNPRLVLGVGGYASGPLVFAAALSGIPTAICEQNTVPGLTNRILSKVVKRIFTAFAEAESHFPKGKIRRLGNPVRKDIQQALDRAPGDGDTRTVFVLGGSQGARFLNQNLPTVLAQVAERAEASGYRLEVIHQSGKNEQADVQKRYADLGLQADVLGFIDDMPGMYNRADLLVCRAGALTISELMLCGRPSILVPFPHAADDHQVTNGKALVDNDAALMVTQDAFDASTVAEQVHELLADPRRLKQMGQRASENAKPDAADDIVAACMELIR